MRLVSLLQSKAKNRLKACIWYKLACVKDTQVEWRTVMKKKISVLLVCIISVIGLFGCSSSKSAATILIMSDVQEQGHPTAMACDKFAELVKEKTNGRIIIETYHGSTLGTEEDQIKQVAVGGIDFSRNSTAGLAIYDDNFKALQALYLYKNDEHMWNVLNGEIGDSLLNSDKLKQNGVIGLTWYTGGSRNFYNDKKEVKSPTDLSGLNIRVNTDSMISFLKKVGATPKNVSYNDIFSSIQSGALDGAENNWPSYISTNHYSVAKYITVDEHTSIPEMIIASKATMDKLSAEDQKIIKECAQESTKYQIEEMKKYDDKAIQTAKDAGCTITYLNDSQAKQFQDAAVSVNEDVNAKYMTLINKIKAVN